jgi:hypothetical protein
MLPPSSGAEVRMQGSRGVYIGPEKQGCALLPCLVTSAPEDGDSMFLRNVGISLQIHGAKPKTSTTTVFILV